MTLRYRAAVLHQADSPLQIETIAAAPIAPSDVLVRVRAAGLCHTDLEVIDGSLRYPMPIVLGHEAAGVIEDVGPAVRQLKKGDRVVLSWNPIAAIATIAIAAFRFCARSISPRVPRRCSSTAPARRGAQTAKSSIT
jgi:NADPH:quinone reductase-like Zn-dependent oxidoreductase